MCPECPEDCQQGRHCPYRRPLTLGPWLRMWFEKEWLYKAQIALTIVAAVLTLQILIWLGIF